MATPSFAAIECAAELTPTRVGGDVRMRTVHFSLKKNRRSRARRRPANVRGLRPGKHGINVHENGDVVVRCRGACTGKSYNPEKRPTASRVAEKVTGASASFFRRRRGAEQAHRRSGEHRRR